jgi:glycosyltransferase involved in cell wall biosynthesis
MVIAFILGRWTTSMHGKLSPEDLYVRRALTGSESSFFNMARALSERGHQVTVYCDTSEERDACKALSGAKFVSIDREIEAADAYVSLSEPDRLMTVPKGGLRVCWSQLGDFGGNQKADFDSHVDLYVGLSPAHVEYATRVTGDGPRKTTPGKWRWIPNSINEEFSQGSAVSREPHRLAWCSSPDRGLHHLIGMFPDIREQVPGALLDIYYRFDPWYEQVSKLQSAVGDRAKYINECLNRLGRDGENGVKVWGATPNVEMARRLRASGVLPYTADCLRFTETFSVSVMDACAAGCLPIISNCDALPNIYGGVATQIDGKPSERRGAWISAIVKAMTEDRGEEREKCRVFARHFTRERVVPFWERLLSRDDSDKDLTWSDFFARSAAPIVPPAPPVKRETLGDIMGPISTLAEFADFARRHTEEKVSVKRETLADLAAKHPGGAIEAFVAAEAASKVALTEESKKIVYERFLNEKGVTPAKRERILEAFRRIMAEPDEVEDSSASPARYVDFANAFPPVRPMRIAVMLGALGNSVHGIMDVRRVMEIDGSFATGTVTGFFNIAWGLAERGHTVDAFCECKENVVGFAKMGGANFYDVRRERVDTTYDAYIAINEPDLLRDRPQDKVRLVANWLNDYSFCRPGWDETVDAYACPSETHRRYMRSRGEAPSEKYEVVPLSTSLELHERVQPRVPGSIAYCSSPDRGLHHLLNMFPLIKAKVPGASLKIYYRFRPWYEGIVNERLFDNTHMRWRADQIKGMLDKLGEDGSGGVTLVGPVSPRMMAEELGRTEVFAYPCDPVRFTEGFSCAVLEACAAGCVPIVAAVDALPEMYSGAAQLITGNPGEKMNEWVEAICTSLTNEQIKTDARLAARTKARELTRQRAAEKWEQLILRRKK